MSFLTHPITGGELVLPRVEQQINSFLSDRGCRARLIIGWGMCELGSTISSYSATCGKSGSAGFPIKNVTVSAFDTETGLEQRYGQRGELRVLSPARMKGYYKNEAATSQFFHVDKNGQKWGCTGDIGYVDEDGDIFILGRASDSYLAEDGVQTYLFDAEAVILRDSAVSKCKVVDMEVNGKTVSVAHLILNDSMLDIPQVLSRIDSACRAELRPCAVPIAFKTRTAFPVHSSGKRDSDALRKERDGYIDAAGRSISF